MKFILKFLPSNKTLAKVILLSLGLHLIFGLFFGSKVLLEHLRPDEVVLAAPPPAIGVEPQKRQYKVRVEKSQKSSSSPRPVPIAVDIPSDVSIEKVDIKVTQTSRVRGRGQSQGEGNGNGNGNGTGTGTGVSFEPDFIDFFGTRSKGERVCFIVDYSLSMGGGKIDRVRQELIRSLDQLSVGSKVSMVFFSGPCWIAGEDAEEIRENWSNVNERNRDRFNNADYGDWGWAPRFEEGRDGDQLKITKPKWKKVSPQSINEFKQYVLETPLTFGTDWGPPFELVIEELRPTPDVIFFLTDGSPQVANEDKVVEFVKKKVRRKKTVINTISMGVPAAAPFLKEIAEFTGGEFKLL